MGIAIDVHHTKEGEVDGKVGSSVLLRAAQRGDQPTAAGPPPVHNAVYFLLRTSSGDAHLKKRNRERKKKTKPHGGLVSCAKARSSSPSISFGHPIQDAPLFFSSVPDWRILDERRK